MSLMLRSQQECGACAVYWYLFFASRILPGVPSWEAPPEQYKEILNQSINFWYCNNAFEAAGWPHIPNEAVRPRPVPFIPAVPSCKFEILQPWLFQCFNWHIAVKTIGTCLRSQTLLSVAVVEDCRSCRVYLAFALPCFAANGSRQGSRTCVKLLIAWPYCMWL